MQIVRERPDQRRFHRVTAPLKVTMPTGECLGATNWSLGGLRLDNLVTSLPSPGDILHLTIELPFQGFDISFDVATKVVRLAKETRTLGLEFLDLNERAHELMSHFINDLLRGQMATVEDTICRIDVPVTPISTQPDVNPTAETPVRRLPIKSIVMSTFYVVLGLAVFGYLAVLGYTKLMRLEVRSAVVTAPLAKITMPMDGYLVPVRMAVDARVQRGDEIARVVNSQIEQRIEDQKIEVDQAKSALRRAEEKFRIDQERMKLYQIINRTDRGIAKARVESAAEGLRAADANLTRVARLFREDLISEVKFEEAKQRQVTAESRLREAELGLERSTAMEAVSARRYYNHKEFVADLDMLALEVEAAQSRLKLAFRQLEKVEKIAANMTIRAPFDGRIVAVSQPGNVTVAKNEQVLVMEKSSDISITAYLDQDQVLSVGLNDVANVYLPSLGQTIEARVARIDRDNAFLDSEAGAYRWKEDAEKSASVSLQFDLNSAVGRYVQAGLPAVVVFPRRSTNEFYNRIGQQVQQFAGDMSHGREI